MAGKELTLAQRVRMSWKKTETQKGAANPCSKGTKMKGTKMKGLKKKKHTLLKGAWHKTKHLVKRWVFPPNLLALLVKRIELFS